MFLSVCGSWNNGKTFYCKKKKKSTKKDLNFIKVHYLHFENVLVNDARRQLARKKVKHENCLYKIHLNEM